MTKIVVVVEGGVVQNVISTEDFVGDVFLIDYDRLEELDEDELVFFDLPLEKDDKEVERLLTMTLAEII